MNPDLRPRRTRPHQRGSVAVTVALSLFLLLGFMGLALDFGRLFVIKGELQTAVDSCALAAAGELDRSTTALDRAKSAALSAANLNRVDFQSATWGGQGGLTVDDVTFLDADNKPTNSPAQAKYARCAHAQSGVSLWLLPALGVFTGDAALKSSTQDVSASAVATRASAQSSCPLPLGFVMGTAVGPNYGLQVGQWVKLLMGPGAATQGQIGWANLDGSSNAAETERELSGFCGTRKGDQLGTPGVQVSVADAWNARFGLYKSAGDPSLSRPDFTGYAYTSLSWPAGKEAYADYLSKSEAFSACAGSVSDCEALTGLKLKGGFKNILASGANGHGLYGAKRRIATVPVLNASRRVDGFLCMLVLQPLSVPLDDTYLEFLGNAADASSPCATAGLPGGATGALVPALVR